MGLEPISSSACIVDSTSVVPKVRKSSVLGSTYECTLLPIFTLSYLERIWQSSSDSHWNGLNSHQRIHCKARYELDITNLTSDPVGEEVRHPFVQPRHVPPRARRNVARPHVGRLVDEECRREVDVAVVRWQNQVLAVQKMRSLLYLPKALGS